MSAYIMIPDSLILSGYSLTTLGHNLKYIILSKLTPFDYLTEKDITVTITIYDWKNFIEIETPGELNRWGFMGRCIFSCIAIT
jgi:hypothetical protein